MDTYKIKVLFKALECGSLTKAADALGYSQPAVTQMMKTLEESVGFSLLVKTNRGVELTSEGEQLIPAMRKILDDEERFYQESAELRGMHSGTLRIGSFVSTSVHWLPKVLEYFQQHYPEVNIRIMEDGHDGLLNALREREIDVALISDYDERNIEFIPVHDDPMVVAYSKKHDLSAFESVTMEDIRDLPFLLSEETYDRDAHRLILQSGYEPDVRYTSRDAYAVLSMVRHGIGITIVPKLVVDGFSGGLQTVPYKPEYYRKLGVAIRSWEDTGPLTRFFIKFIQENIK